MINGKRDFYRGDDGGVSQIKGFSNLGIISGRKNRQTANAVMIRQFVLTPKERFTVQDVVLIKVNTSPDPSQ